MLLNVACPHCGALLDVTPEWLGQQIECGGCSSVFVCPEFAEEPPPDAAPKPKADKKSRREREDKRWDGYGDYRRDEDPDSYSAKLRGPGYATASMVLGILALTLGSFFTISTCGFGGFIQTIMSVIGLILGYIGLRSDARGNAIAGMAMSVLGALMSILYMAFMGVCFSLKPFGPPPPPPPTPVTISTPKPNANGTNPPPKFKK